MSGAAIPSISRRAELLLLSLIAAAALARVIATYPHFCQTFDEPVHIAAGAEWLQRGTYSTAVHNPPLPRILEAIGPAADGAQFVRLASPIDAGNAILYSGGDYLRRLSLARTGNLPFLLIAIAAVWAWGRAAAGNAAGGLASALLFTTASPILGHAGVATNDMAGVATFTLLIVAALRWLDVPSSGRAGAVGIAAALATLSKFTALYFAVVALVPIVVFRLRDRGGIALRAIAKSIAIVALIAAPLVWAGYRFSIADASRLPELVLPDSPLLPLLQTLARAGIDLPAPELVAGLGELPEMNRRSTYPAYFMGHVDQHGFPLFYPTVFAVKTSVALLILFVGSFFVAGWRRGERRWIELSPLIAAAAILAISLTIHIDAGIRYVLPLYAAVACAAGLAVALLWQRTSRMARAAAVVLIAAQAGVSLAAAPDYLADFNVLAGPHPERIVIDSDLDWGQDLLRLAAAARERGITRLHLAYFGTAIPSAHAIAPELIPLRPGERVTGWVAISEVYRAPIWTAGYQWLSAYEPAGRAGSSIVLYDIPPVRVSESRR